MEISTIEAKPKQEITHRTIGSQIEWTCKSHKPLTKNDAEILQAASGYAPQGYSCYGFNQELKDDMYVCTWFSYSSY